MVATSKGDIMQFYVDDKHKFTCIDEYTFNIGSDQQVTAMASDPDSCTLLVGTADHQFIHF